MSLKETTNEACAAWKCTNCDRMFTNDVIFEEYEQMAAEYKRNGVTIDDEVGYVVRGEMVCSCGGQGVIETYRAPGELTQ